MVIFRSIAHYDVEDCRVCVHMFFIMHTGRQEEGIKCYKRQ